MVSSANPSSPSSSPSTDDAASVKITESCNEAQTPNNQGINDGRQNTLRHRLGNHLSALSDTINSNLIIVRYGTIGSIVLLGAYGISNTPLFYRYKSVWDIPGHMWSKRRWVNGRIVGVLEKNGDNVKRGVEEGLMVSDTRQGTAGLSSLLSSSLKKKASVNYVDGETSETNQFNSNTTNSSYKTNPVVILFRHSSPMERLLTQNAMDKVLTFTGHTPSRMLYSSTKPHRNLLPIELAGISYPPPLPSSVGISTPHEEIGLLRKLAEAKSRVSIQLLAQRATLASLPSSQREEGIPLNEDVQNTAICHMTYHKPKQWFSSTNVGLELVASGQAIISSCVVPESSKEQNDKTTILNFNPTAKQLQNDASFMSQLEDAEYDAWKSKLGIWSAERMRQLKSEYAEEERYVSNQWSTRFMNLLKKGWSMVRR